MKVSDVFYQSAQVAGAAALGLVLCAQAAAGDDANTAQPARIASATEIARGLEAP